MLNDFLFFSKMVYEKGSCKKLHRVQKKRGHSFLCIDNFNKCRHSFVMFGTNHPEDSFYQENRKVNIITSIHSDDVIVTSLETPLSRRTASGSDTFCLISNNFRKLKHIVVFLPSNINEVRRN